MQNGDIWWLCFLQRVWKLYSSSKWNKKKIPRRERKKMGWRWAGSFSRYAESQYDAQNARAEYSRVLQASLLNEFFAPVGGYIQRWKEKTTGVLWHETIKGRWTQDVVTTYINFTTENREIFHFIFWLDNCSGQNRNWHLYHLLMN